MRYATLDGPFVRAPRCLRRYQKPVNFTTQSFSHFSTAYIGNGMQCETVEELIMVHKILPNAINHQM